MDRGWGLTLDNSDKVGFFGNNPVFGVNSSPRLDHRSSGLIMFPVSSRGREDLSSPPQPQGEQRLALGEVDFFAEKRRPANGAVKKEDSSHAEASAGRELDVNVSCCIYVDDVIIQSKLLCICYLI